MKRLLIYLTILLMAIMTSCKSAPHKEQEIILPPMPQRQKIKMPAELKDYVLIIAYYDNLVEQWELWGETVENLIEVENGINPEKIK